MPLNGCSEWMGIVLCIVFVHSKRHQYSSQTHHKFISINGQKWDPWADPFFIIIVEKYVKLESHHLHYYPQNGHFSLVNTIDVNHNQVEIRIAFKVSSKIPLFLEFDIADVEFYVELNITYFSIYFFFF